MQIAQYHVFACEQQKPEGAPSCSACGSKKVVERLRAEVASQGLADRVQITTCGSLGLCESGPNMVVYPEGTWYGGMTPGDVPELVREHFGNGRPLARAGPDRGSGDPAEMETTCGNAGLAAMQGPATRPASCPTNSSSRRPRHSGTAGSS